MKPSAEFDAAKITGPRLRAGYARCRALLAEHGRTYYLAAQLLTPNRRPAVYALYGFARWVDDMVDAVGPEASAQRRTAELESAQRQLTAALAGTEAEHPVLAALVHTLRQYRIDESLLTAFMASMRMDLTVSEYATFTDLGRYMHGSAEVIGLQMLPVLGTLGPRAEAERPAAALGVAFQLTNFLRDVGEDLDRGRVYLPQEELAAFGVHRELLTWCRHTGRPDSRVRRALAHLVAWTRGIYRTATPGIALLRPESRPCVDIALRLYQGILDEIVAADYHVLARRVVVPNRRRLAVAAPAYARALLTRQRAARVCRV